MIAEAGKWFPPTIQIRQKFNIKVISTKNLYCTFFKLSTVSLLYFCFQIVVLENILESHWTARRSNQSSLKEINPEFSLEGLMLKLQYFGQLMRKANSLEKPLMLRKIEGKRRRGWQRMRWLDSNTDSMDMNLSKLGDSGGLRSQEYCSPWSCKQLETT